MWHLSYQQKWLLSIISFFIVAFGQPAWHWLIGLVAAVIGYALFFRVLLTIPRASHRFWISTGWFTAIEIVHLSWSVSHPYLYIYAALLIFSFLVALQFGLLSFLIRPKAFTRVIFLAGTASLWAVMEWTRLFFLSGYSWNPAGLALTGAIYPLQLASLWGVFGLSFWVMFVNLLAVRAWIAPKKLSILLFIGCALFPYAYGFIHYHIHEKSLENYPVDPLSVVLVQPSFPVEESLNFRDAEELRGYVVAEWRQILSIMKKQLGKQIDLIVLPEYVVPFGTYYPIFTQSEIQNAFKEVFEIDDLKFLPRLEEPLAGVVETANGHLPLLSNAYWVQAIANFFNADVVAGFEDERFNAALYFRPYETLIQRYEKRVLVPMGEYIPLELFRKLAERYGISGSFSCGKEAKIFQGKIPFSTSICYEETFGDLMMEGRAKGAELLVNITSDAWYPNSRLPQQHFDHARLRTVENGIPLVRACNTGVTGAIDSLGRIIGILDEDGETAEWKSDSLYINVPTYHYSTPYSKWGDKFILILSFLLIASALLLSAKRDDSFGPHIEK